MKKIIWALVFTVLTFEMLSANTIVWTGGAGRIEWGASTWLDRTTGTEGVQPGQGDTVVFRSAATDSDFTVTPPAGFHGTILTENHSDNNGDLTTLDKRYMPSRVRIENVNRADFKIGGAGILEAYDGITSMLVDDFAGVIDIPKGMTLHLGTSFPPAATITGVGTLVPAVLSQLGRAGTFCGTLDLRQIETLELGGDSSVLMGRTVIFGDKVTCDAHRMTSTVEPLDLSAAKWTFNSALQTISRECVPFMDTAGTLTLPHVEGVTNKTSVFLNRRFRPDESFVLKFRLRIEAKDGICGFGIVMRKGELTDVASGEKTWKDGAIPSDCYGLTTMYYNTWGHVSAFERLAGATRFQETGSWPIYQGQEQSGMVLRNGDPFDVVVVCRESVLTVSLTQSGITRTFRQSVAPAFADERGAMFGFVTHEDCQESHRVGLKVCVSDFCGWVSSDANGQWIEDASGDFVLNADNYHLYLDYLSGTETNSFRGADALDASGRLRVTEEKAWYGAAVSKKCVPGGKRFLLEWTNDIGDVISNSGDHTDVGFVKLDDEEITTYYGNPAVADGSGLGDLVQRQYLTKGDPIKFVSYWYGSLVGLTRTWKGGTAVEQYTGTVETFQGAKTRNSSNCVKWIYDGDGVHEVRMINDVENIVHRFELSNNAVLESDRRISFVGAGALTWSCYAQNWIGGIRLSYWNEQYVPRATLCVLAPASARTVMSGVGVYAPVSRIELEDSAARIEYVGDVAFGAELTIVVSGEFIADNREEACLVDLTAASVVGALPSVVRLVDETGASVPLHGRTVKIDPRGIWLSGPLGLILLVR